MNDALDHVSHYLASKGLKNTRQRQAIVSLFLHTKGHLDVAEFHQRVKEVDDKVGYTTVYRTLKLLAECGVAHKHQFGDGAARYENIWGKDHHDHLVCIKCGKIIEFENETIERLQEKVAAEHDFKIFTHRMELYGHCRKCQQKGKIS